MPNHPKWISLETLMKRWKIELLYELTGYFKDGLQPYWEGEEIKKCPPFCHKGYYALSGGGKALKEYALEDQSLIDNVPVDEVDSCWRFFRWPDPKYKDQFIKWKFQFPDDPIKEIKALLNQSFYKVDEIEKFEVQHEILTSKHSNKHSDDPNKEKTETIDRIPWLSTKPRLLHLLDLLLKEKLISSSLRKDKLAVMHFSCSELIPISETPFQPMCWTKTQSLLLYLISYLIKKNILPKPNGM